MATKSLISTRLRYIPACHDSESWEEKDVGFVFFLLYPRQPQQIFGPLVPQENGDIATGERERCEICIDQ